MSSIRLYVMLTICCLFAAAGVGTADAHARSPRSGGARARSYSHSPGFGRSSALAAGSLTTNQAADPLGIDTRTPQLGWVSKSSASGVSQSSYEIRVATNERSLASGHNLVWDSGPVSSQQSFDISYAGSALASQTRYYWEVRVWDNHGNASQWSRPAWFETAFLDSSQFNGSWIGDANSTSPTGPELLLRKAFTLSNAPITRARLYVSGLSFPYTDINGHPVSSNVLDTAFTEYGKSSPWQVEQGSLHAAGGEIGILKQGSAWTDYTMSFDTTPVANQAGWVVRASSANTLYLLILDTSDDSVGPANSLQEVVDQNGTFSTIKNVALPFTVSAGTQYAVSTTVSGTSVTTSINGTQVASFDATDVPGGGISAGTVGFREDSSGAEQADFKDLNVTSSTGATLFSSALDQESDLDAFFAPGTSGSSVDYRTFDVTRLLHRGNDALAVSLGNGFYAGGADDYPTSGEPWQPTQPKLKLELVVWYANGAKSTVVSDGSWKVTTGPTTSNTPAFESYDARLEQPGWTATTFDDSGWSDASVLAAPDAVLRAETIPPVKETTTIKPVKVTDVGTSLPVPSLTDSPTPDWIWNIPGASTSAPIGNIYMRKTFTVADPSSISSAVLRVNADDAASTYVNGTLVSSSPNVTNGWQISQVSDIKPLLVAGTNVIAIEGTAFAANASGVLAVAQLDSTRIVTDGSWKALPGTPASPPDGWNTIGFDDSAWPAADVQAAYGSGPWGSGIQAPVPAGKVYDFGITTSGWARIRLQATAGTEVDIRYSEQLNSDGTVASEGANAQTDTYIAKGGDPETYEPKYGWKGYRYIQVWTPSGAPLQIDSIHGIVAHTDLAADGSFTSSSNLLNTMHAAMVNTILNNQYSYGSDTPVYEKGGWTNDNGDYATSEMDNFDAEPYYDHMMQNFDDSQDLSGNIGFLVPAAPGDDQVDPLWGGSFLLLEYDMYQQYDNLAVIRRDYSHMAAYIDDLAAQIAPSGDIYQGTTFGDWSIPPNDPNPPSSEMLGSMFLYRESMDLSIMASAIGNTADASKYASLAADIRTAVNKEFYDSTNHQYIDPVGLVSHATGGPNGTITSTAYDQTANVFGLAFGLAPNGDEQAIADGLAADVKANGNHLATGANGSKYILPMLTKYGYGDLAYLVATNPTAPGWGQWFLQCGATTMWEAWEDSSCDTARSRDHAFMGTVDDWMFADVAGIQSTSPGFRTIAIAPSAVDELTSASAKEATPLGPVSSSWTRHGSSFALTVHVPVGSTATVCVPAAGAASVTEGGAPVANAAGVTLTGMQGSCLQLKVGSGSYRFGSQLS
jgi:Bacterial alpha-L-rhamnosidase 6 hairpin glycosidase domain/Alpha-L-rhamnosidase N-terminal domain/Bacterial alpha-L-rhamnosidase concanavalin-like domain/Bacterial alpha-L-rhamnosidase C-terminal domain